MRDDHLLYPSANTLALNGYAPSEVGNYLFYPQEVTISLGGHSPDFKFSFAPSIGAGTLTINGQAPVFAKGVFRTVPQGTLTFDIPKWSLGRQFLELGAVTVWLQQWDRLIHMIQKQGYSLLQAAI